jgi:MmyB-like transcription regulator ligand binding domain
MPGQAKWNACTSSPARAAHSSSRLRVIVARALKLDPAETDHLRDLARARSWARPRKPRAERVRPGLVRLLEAIDTPALIFGRRTDVLAWNRGAAALLIDFGALPPRGRNFARLVFLDDGFRALMGDWETVARETVGVLRMAAGRHPDDPELAALVGELTVKSEDFGRWWSSRDVRQKGHGSKRLRHPVVGPLTVAYETMRLPDEPDQVLVSFYAAEAGSPADTALRLLAAG